MFNFKRVIMMCNPNKCHYSSKTLPLLPQSIHFPVINEQMMPSYTFKNRIALVTGGGTGLGRGMSEMIAKCGAKGVIITSRKIDILEKTAKELNEKIGQKNVVIPIQCDIREIESVSNMINKCEDILGESPDVIVNNAAGNFIAPTERLSSRAINTIYDIVLRGTTNVTMETANRLIKKERRGTYLAISTTYAENGSPFVVPSATAKAGIEVLFKSLAAEWGKYGLRFNVIAPGPIYTEGAFDRLDPTGSFIKEAVNNIPCGRLGQIIEIANLAVYILSDHASWFNGSVLRFDGGEVPLCSGEFSGLHRITKDQWDEMEQMIKGLKNKSP